MLGDHGRIVASINEHETGPVTVCLYWNEYQQPAIRKVYADAGFRVITHGYRGLHWRKTDPDFLLKQLEELRCHPASPPTGSAPPSCTAPRSACSPACTATRWCWRTSTPPSVGRRGSSASGPNWTSRSCRLEVAKEFTDTELGVDHVVCPAEIRELFRWND